MEIIKFRIWDHRDKKMIHSGGTPSMLKGFFEDTAILNVQFEMPYMQFTGIYDKGGNDIYEGDILRFPPEDNWDKINYMAYEVFYHDNDCADKHIGFQMGRTRCYGSIGGGAIHGFLPKTTNKMIIVGNIYKNKESLKRQANKALKRNGIEPPSA